MRTLFKIILIGLVSAGSLLGQGSPPSATTFRVRSPEGTAADMSTDSLAHWARVAAGDSVAQARLDAQGYAGDSAAVIQAEMYDSLWAKVDTVNDQTINGVKTFGSFPVTPSAAPTTDYQAANKKYVDDNAGGGGSGTFEPKWFDLAITSGSDAGGNWIINDVTDSTAFTDTLAIAIDSAAHLASSRGREAVLYIGPGLYLVADTVWGRSSTFGKHWVRIKGAPGATVLKFTHDSRFLLHGNFMSKTGNTWSNIIFDGLTFTNPDNDSYAFMRVDSAGIDDMRWENCHFHKWTIKSGTYYYSKQIGGLFCNGEENLGPWTYDAGDNWQFINCVLDSTSIRLFADNTLFQDCRFLNMTYDGVRNVNHNQDIRFIGCTFRWHLTSTLYSRQGHFANQATISFTACDWVKQQDYIYSLVGWVYDVTAISFTGCNFLDPVNKRGTADIERFIQATTTPFIAVIGCTFQRMQIIEHNGNYTLKYRIQGCTFYDSASVSLEALCDGSIITGNTFHNAGTAITLAADCDTCVVGGNTFVDCGAGLADSGTGTITYNNHLTTYLEWYNEGKDYMLALADKLRRYFGLLRADLGVALQG